MYVWFVCNHTASSTPNNCTPIETLTGNTPDICQILWFDWWTPVYHIVNYLTFSSETKELRGCFVGVSEHVEHAVMFRILSEVVSFSNLNADAPSSPYLHAYLFSSAYPVTLTPCLHSWGAILLRAFFSPSEMVGRTFLEKRFNAPQIFCDCHNKHFIFTLK